MMNNLRERYKSRIKFMVGLSIILSVLGCLCVKTGHAAQTDEEKAVREALTRR
jgi:hypothetical protein